MRAILTPDDLKKGDLIEPGWHPAEIVDYDEKEANTDGTTNCNFYFKIIDGPFKDLEGKVGEIDEERGKVKVLVPMFGRETPVELEADQVQRV